MLERIIRASIAHRWVVLMLVLALSGLGIWNYSRLPIDAVPDITNVQVQINTEAAGYSPLEAEQRVTFPVETAMAGLPQLEYTRSVVALWPRRRSPWCSRTAPTSISRANRSAERLQQAKLSPARWAEADAGSDCDRAWARSSCTPSKPSSARRRQPVTPTALRTLQDWVMRPQLRHVPGVTEVNTIGGYVRAISTSRPDPRQAAGLWADARRTCVDARGAQQCQRRRRVISSAAGEQYLIRDARPGGRHPARSAQDRRRHSRRRAAAHRRRGRSAAKAANCAPARPPRTARKSCWAPPSC